MRLDKEKLDELVALPDDRLWEEVVRMAESFGYSLPRRTPPHDQLEKMRSAVRGDKINVGEALRLVNKYRREERG